jgi:hypothetical protein
VIWAGVRFASVPLFFFLFFRLLNFVFLAVNFFVLVVLVASVLPLGLVMFIVS